MNRKYYLICLSFFCMNIIFADDLPENYTEPYYRKKDIPITKFDPLSIILSYIIQLHQKKISDIDGFRSNFYPSSSQFMLESIMKNGPILGFLMGCDRLLRENNDIWVYKTLVIKNEYKVKLDPVYQYK